MLDTHALYWLVSGTVALRNEALVAVGKNQEAGTLFVSPITAWELSIAVRKPPHRDRPDLGQDSPARWFRDAVRTTAAKVVPIKQRIAIAAAEVVTETGHKDTGDCYLIATARMRRMPLVTRDASIREIASEKPGYLDVIVC